MCFLYCISGVKRVSLGSERTLGAAMDFISIRAAWPWEAYPGIGGHAAQGCVPLLRDQQALLGKALVRFQAE